MKPSPGPTDWIFLLALTVIWGSAFLLTKIAVTALPPSLVVAGRLAVAAVCLTLLVAAVRRPLPRGGRNWLFLLLIALFGNTLPFSLISWGQQSIDSGLAGILMAVMPLFTLGLAHYFVPNERLSLQRAIGFLVGFGGIVVLLGPESLRFDGAGAAELAAMLAVLAGAGCYAVSAILARLRPSTEVLGTAMATTVFAAAMAAPIAATSNFDPTKISAGEPGALLAVLGLGLFSTALAAVLYFRLINRAGPAFVSQLNYLIPLWAVGIGIVFLGEEPQANHLYALLLILVGILVTQWNATGSRRMTWRTVVEPRGR